MKAGEKKKERKDTLSIMSSIVSWERTKLDSLSSASIISLTFHHMIWKIQLLHKFVNRIIMKDTSKFCMVIYNSFYTEQ